MNHVHHFRRFSIVTWGVEGFGIDMQVISDDEQPGAWFVGYECICGEMGYAA